MTCVYLAACLFYRNKEFGVTPQGEE